VAIVTARTTEKSYWGKVLILILIIQTMSHIINFCPLTKFDGGLLRLHEADEAAVDWLTTYGS